MTITKKAVRSTGVLLLLAGFLLWQNWSVNAQNAHGLREAWAAVTKDVNGNTITVDSYNIYRGAATGQTNTKIGTVTGSTLTYLDTTGVGGTTYFYAVSAVKGTIEGAKGADASGVFPLVPAQAGVVSVTQE